jgi:hypothetical protein
MSTPFWGYIAGRVPVLHLWSVLPDREDWLRSVCGVNHMIDRVVAGNLKALRQCRNCIRWEKRDLVR